MLAHTFCADHATGHVFFIDDEEDGMDPAKMGCNQSNIGANVQNILRTNNSK